jgi:hypothetical protein
MKVLTGVYEADVPSPHGSRTIQITLDDNGGTLSGAMNDPDDLSTELPLSGSVDERGKVLFQARSEGCVYQAEGAIVNGADGAVSGLLVDVTVTEAKELMPGPLVSAENARREYIIGVYSPGGVRENHFVIDMDGSSLSGEMYCVADEKEVAFLNKMASENKLPPFVKIPNPGERTDVNALNGTIDGNSVIFSTTTAQGSLFTFEGTADDGMLALNMKIVNVWKGVKADSLFR